MMPHEQLKALHRTLRMASAVVPRSRREAWRAEWIAELSYLYREDPSAAMECSRGIVRDALETRRIAVVVWWRSIDWQQPETCLLTLGCVFLSLVALTMSQGTVRHLVFSKWGHGAFACFVALALFSVPSTVVTSRYGAYEAHRGEAATLEQRLLRWKFLGYKLVLVVLSAYLLAVQVIQPFQQLLRSQADWLLVACGLLFNVVAVNWALTDQRERCPTCMRLLRHAARMGTPSWSLLASSTTEEMCDRGHGLLHQPDWQTSWFENARWLQLDRTWQELFRP